MRVFAIALVLVVGCGGAGGSGSVLASDSAAPIADADVGSRAPGDPFDGGPGAGGVTGQAGDGGAGQSPMPDADPCLTRLEQCGQHQPSDASSAMPDSAPDAQAAQSAEWAPSMLSIQTIGVMSLKFTLINTGTAPVYEYFALSDDPFSPATTTPISDFQIIYLEGTNPRPCKDGGTNLGPGESCQLTVRYSGQNSYRMARTVRLSILDESFSPPTVMASATISVPAN